MSVQLLFQLIFFFFFFNDTATTEIYTLSLHDALPILDRKAQLFVDHEEGLATEGAPQIARAEAVRFEPAHAGGPPGLEEVVLGPRNLRGDRKSTRLNSSH